MMTDKSNYKSALKATSLFGGVQVYSILLTLISSKFIAVLLGPEGMGLSSLLSSTVSIIGTFTALGLGTSAVRDVSVAFASGDTNRFNLVVSAFRKIVWFTGLFGMAVCLFLSPLWSLLTFDTYDYVWSFVILSVTLLVGQVSSGQGVVMQGTRRFKEMAKSRLIGGTIGLFVTIPLYFLWGVKGIVPAMVIMSVVGLLISYHYSRKVPVEKVSLQLKEIISEGKSMLKMGFFISIQASISMMTFYLIRIYISHVGGLGEVGLYNSGFSMVDMSVGLIFSAMGTEYYPRLSSVANDVKKFSDAINQQISISLILMAPIISFFLLLGEYAILILLSPRFLSITLMIQILVLNTFVKATGFCLGYSFLAKSDSKAFWMNELWCKILQLLSITTAYSFWGLNGVAIAFTCCNFLYIFVTSMVCRYRYEYHFDLNLIRIALPQIIICVCIFICVAFVKELWAVALASCLCLLSSYLCYIQLNRIINIKSALLSIKDKLYKK